MRRMFKWKFPMWLLKKEFKEAVTDTKKECGVSETMREAPLKHSLIFQYLWKRVILIL